MKKKPTQFDFWFAVNNTEIVLPPKRPLETFGNTIINYHLVSELMDSIGKVRIREGRMQFLRPQIITPSSYSFMLMEGFGEEARRYMEWLRNNEDSIRILRYGYNLKQEAFSEQVVTDSLEAVIERIKSDVSGRKDPFAAIVKGVDNPWDVCLLHLFKTVTLNSVKANVLELHERRMFELEDGIPVGLREDIEKAFQAASQDANLIKALGKMLQDNGVFEQYQDRFFNLVQRRN